MGADVRYQDLWMGADVRTHSCWVPRLPEEHPTPHSLIGNGKIVETTPGGARVAIRLLERIREPGWRRALFGLAGAAGAVC
jgi:hypothetical protein